VIDHLPSAMSNHISEKVDFPSEAAAEADGSDNGTSIPVELAPEEHAHLSVGDILRGTAVHELNPFERKAALINS
jgi:hypothetical protein